jgi:hypothetical protein
VEVACATIASAACHTPANVVPHDLKPGRECLLAQSLLLRYNVKNMSVHGTVFLNNSCKCSASVLPVSLVALCKVPTSKIPTTAKFIRSRGLRNLFAVWLFRLPFSCRKKRELALTETTVAPTLPAGSYDYLNQLRWEQAMRSAESRNHAWSRRPIAAWSPIFAATVEQYSFPQDSTDYDASHPCLARIKQMYIC